MDAAMEVFHLSQHFPDHERFSLTDQMRRSSRSVAANRAEVWRKRRYPAAFVNKLNDSEVEAAEKQTHLEIALRCGYLDQETVRKLDSCYEEILSMLVAMINQRDKWIISAEKRKEDAEKERRGDGEKRS
jgi:four helix bundle protein